MRVNLIPATDEGVLYIASNMRERDRAEIFATRWDDDPATLTRDCMYCITQPNSMTVMATRDREPVAVLGAWECWPGTWEVWCFGTDDFDHVALSLTRYVRKVLIPLLLKRGLRRGHCRSMVGHDKAHEWLRSLGAVEDEERPMKAWGRDGEDFVMFVWHREELLKTYTEAA